jgi:transcriptional regulator with XRE-family HTH domain
MVDNKIIGSRIERLRKKRKETQTDLAGVLNVKRQVISYYETGARTPNVDDLIILAEHYNTTVDYLLGRTENK